MNYLNRLSAKNAFGALPGVPTKKNNIINIICGVLLIILIIILIVCLTTNNDNFGNESEPHMILFFSEKCGFSKKIDEDLKQHHSSGDMLFGNKIKRVNINSKMANELGVTGTPTFYCTGSKKKSVGYKPLKKIHEELTGNKDGKHDEHVHKNGNGNKRGRLAICGNDRCPYCRKLYEYSEKNGINFEKIDSNSDRGNEFMKSLGANAIPLILLLDDADKVIEHAVGYDEKFLQKHK